MIIIGAGRVGGALHHAANEKGVQSFLIDRESGWDRLETTPGTPVMLAVRNDDLLDVIGRVPPHRRDDLVFVQNGAVRDFLQTHALGSATRGLLFFAVPSRGAPIEPGGLNPFCGRHASACAQFLGALGLQAAEVDWARFSAYELEKMLWNAIFGLMCERFDAPVGEILTDHRPTLEQLVRELSQVGRAVMNVEIPHDFLVERLVSYSARIPDYQGSVKEWPWRNGWFVEKAKLYRVDTPLHDDMLRAIGRLD